jgi:Domain of unknown function DUF11
LAGTTVALVLLTGLLTGTAIAKPPTYGQDWSATPSEFVSYGGQVRFDVEWTNLSGANLPTVFVSADTPTGADLIAVIDGTVSQGTCDDTGEDLACAFGTVNNGANVSFAVVYEVPASGSDTFSVKFVFTAQGNTGSDQPGKSRGDDMPITASVSLTDDPDEGGTYVYGDVTSLANNQALHKTRNPQSALLDFIAAGNQGFGATLDEAAGTTYPCPGQTTCYGFWNLVSVNEGTAITGGFETVLGYSQVPSNAVGGFVHWLTANTTNPVLGTDYELITEECEYDSETGDATNMPCIASVAKIQGNTFFTILSETNGPMRGY